MTDAELELHIADLGRLIEKSFADGDRAGALAWAAARVQAINARSPEQIARMEAALGLAPCYLHERGEADRAAAEGRR